MRAVWKLLVCNRWRHPLRGLITGLLGLYASVRHGAALGGSGSTLWRVLTAPRHGLFAVWLAPCV